MAKVLFISIFDDGCKGIRYLGSVLLAHHHQVELLLLKPFKDSTIPSEVHDEGGWYGERFFVSPEELQLTVEEIRRFSPDLIGITVSSYITGVAEWLTRHIKETFKDIPVVWGGVDVTFNPERAIQAADMICLGEAEEAMVELADTVSEGKDPATIRNLWVKRNGTIVKNPMRPLLQNLDELPLPLYDPHRIKLVRGCTIKQFDPEAAESMPPYVHNTRGCPSECTYCYNGPVRDIFKGQKFLRTQSVEKLMQELKELRRWYPHLDYVRFSDDVFGYQRSWTEEFVARYRRECALPFNHYIHPRVTTYELLKLLREAGLFSAVIGVQTASERILRDVYKRPFYPEQIRQRVEWIHQLDLWIVIELILYNPFEDESDLEQTFNFIAHLPKPIGFPMVSELWLFENFPIIHLAREQGVALRQLDDSHTFLSNKDRALNAFYAELIKYASLEYAPLEALERIRRERIFFDQPELIGELMSHSLYGQALHVREVWMSKDKIIRELQRELNQLKGSRLHRVAEQLRHLLRAQRPE